MFEHNVITEPKWKSYIIETQTPLLTPQQCNEVINCGRNEKPQEAMVGNGNKQGGGLDKNKRTTTISWIPFAKMPPLYEKLNEFIQKANLNHFGFDDVRVTEQAQFTEYPTGGFYEWDMDSDTVFIHEPPVRKISMTLLLNHESEFDGGELEILNQGKKVPLKQGNAICFASFLNHRVKPVTRGIRQSLVVWFGGKPFK